MIAGGFWFLFCGRAAPFIKCIVEKYHQFQKCGTIQDVFSESGIGAQFMNKIDKPGLFFCGEMDADAAYRSRGTENSDSDPSSL